MTADRRAQRTSRKAYKRLAATVAFFRRAETFTHREVEIALGLKPTASGNLLREMWRPGPSRQIRICAWRNDALGRPTIRVFEFCEDPEAPDEKRRPPKSAKLRQISYLERKDHRAQVLAQTVILNMAAPA